MSYCIPHLQGRCSVSEMQRNLNVWLLLFRPWCYSLDHESKICEKNEGLWTSVHFYLLVQLLFCTINAQMALLSIKYVRISPHTPPVPSLFRIQSLVLCLFVFKGPSSECLLSVISIRAEMGKWRGFSIAWKAQRRMPKLRISGIPTLFRFQLVN